MMYLQALAWWHTLLRRRAVSYLGFLSIVIKTDETLQPTKLVHLSLSSQSGARSTTSLEMRKSRAERPLGGEGE